MTTLDRRRFLVASLGGAAALFAGSCAPSSSPGAGQGAGRSVHLTEGALGFPSPFAANAGFGYTQMSYLYDTLLWKDGSGQFLPWLAESYTTSADHLTYTFILRDNLKWSDGRPLTADDVVFTFEYYAKQTISPAVIVQPPKGIAHVTASGAKSVEITLTSPLVTFVEQVVAAIPIIPRHVWSSIADAGGAQDLKVLVGTGAYRLASYHQDQGPMLYLARNDYFLGRPFVQRIEQRGVNDSISGLLSGSVDIAYVVNAPGNVLSQFRANPAYGTFSDVGTSTQAMYWNLGKEGALSDVRFRRAMLMAIDGTDLVTRIAAGRGLPGNPGFLAPSNPYYAPVPLIPFDVAGANALLDGAGYRSVGGGGTRRNADGKPMSFELLMDEAQAPLSEILVGDLKRIGVELRPKLVAIGPQLFGSKVQGAYDIAVLPFPGPGPGGPSGDPDILRLLFSFKANVGDGVSGKTLQGATNYVNPAFDALADQQKVSFDVTERKAIVAQMQTILAQDLPVVPLFYNETDVAYRKQVLDQWYLTPGQFPSWQNNKQLLITGQKTGTSIRSTP